MKRARINYSEDVSPLTSGSILGAPEGSTQNFVDRNYSYSKKPKALKLKTKGDKKIAKISRALIARALRSNEECKFYITGTYGQSVAQTLVTAGPVSSTGHWSTNMAFPSAGTGVGQMVGQSIKLQKVQFAFQFSGQAATANKGRLKFYLVKQTAAISGATVSQIWQPNYALDLANGGTGAGTAVLVYDNQSMRNPNYQDSTKIIKEIDIVVEPGNAIAAGTSIINTVVKFEIPLFGAKQTLSGGSAWNTIYTMFLLADDGNRGTVNGALVNAPIQTANTGLNFIMTQQLWYTDA